MTPVSVTEATPAQDVAARRAALVEARAEHAAALKRLASIEARMGESSADLDRLVDDQVRAQQRLSRRAASLYRSGRVDLVVALLGAEDFESFTARWELLERITQQDAAAVVEAKAARERATRSGRDLVRLQERASREMRTLERAMTAARIDLATSRAAYAAQRARIAGADTRPARPAPKRQTKRTGEGAWQTAKASHYGRGSWGRLTADGTRIHADSMIVAHKTLPFDTLVEFSFRGKTAVARVADRGPYTKGRTWDLGPGVIRILDFNGVHMVKYRIIGR